MQSRISQWAVTLHRHAAHAFRQHSVIRTGQMRPLDDVLINWACYFESLVIAKALRIHIFVETYKMRESFNSNGYAIALFECMYVCMSVGKSWSLKFFLSPFCSFSLNRHDKMQYSVFKLEKKQGNRILSFSSGHSIIFGVLYVFDVEIVDMHVMSICWRHIWICSSY